MTKASLADKLEQALKEGISIDDIESAVGEKALLSTLRPEGRNALAFVDIETDPLHPDLPPHFSVETDAVAYWDRKTGEEDVNVVGAFWKGQDGEGHLFYGIIGPP